MDAILWILLPVLVALGAAILSFYIMQAKLEVAVAKERETLAEVRAKLQTQEQALPERIKAAQEEAQRKAFDQFLLDFRVEERHYMRETKSHFLTRKSMIMQERLFFRNIPLSNWVEHEMPLEEGGDMQNLVKDSSIFGGKALGEHGKGGPRLLPQ